MNSRRQRAARKVSVRDAPAQVLSQLDEVLSVDLRVYRAAVMRLLCDLRALEAATGRAVLCAPRLAALRNKTSYVTGLWDGAGAAAVLDEWAEARVGYRAAGAPPATSAGGAGGAGGALGPAAAAAAGAGGGDGAGGLPAVGGGALLVGEPSARGGGGRGGAAEAARRRRRIRAWRRRHKAREARDVVGCVI